MCVYMSKQSGYAPTCVPPEVCMCARACVRVRACVCVFVCVCARARAPVPVGLCLFVVQMLFLNPNDRKFVCRSLRCTHKLNQRQAFSSQPLVPQEARRF